MKIFPLFLLILVGLALAGMMGTGCTGTGHLQEGERLYVGAKVKITKKEKDWDTKILKTDLRNAVVLPRPNKKIGWMRPRLVIYNMFQNRREKSIGNFIANQFGEPPVLFEPKIANRHRELLAERAANDGFFKTTCDASEKVRKHSVQLRYEVHVRSPRELVDSVSYAKDSTRLTRSIATLQPQALVRPGLAYHLEDMIAERQRLGDTLRNHGWYFFSPDHLLFEADTLRPPGSMNLTLKVKPGVTQRERQQYRIGTVTVYPDYFLAKQSDSTLTNYDTLRFGCIQYVYRAMTIRPEILNEQITLHCGQHYSNNDYQMTIYRLLNLNVYKFINIRFDVSASADTLLDASIYLTPNRPQRVDATLSGVFSPSFYYGILGGASYNHRNLFRGAEAFRFSLNTAYLNTDKANFGYDDFVVTDATARFTLPRFVFFPKKTSRAFSTSTFSMRHESNWFKYNVEDYPTFRLSFQRLQAEGGYSWKKNRSGSVTQQINPINLGFQYSTITNREIRRILIQSIPYDTTGATLSLLNFVEYKPNYTFTLDERLKPAQRYTQYFRQRIAGQASGYTPNKLLPKDFRLASPLNVFLESDYRQYQKTHGRNVLALRVAAGAVIPLRRNGTIALLDRYIVGGASSVRAFAPRSVGPGSVKRDDPSDGLGVGNYTGNVLIESSLEYRVPVGRYPELAFFLDIGNVWLTSGAEATEASRFRFNRFYKEFAAGTGMGLRINLGFFILRLDAAFPLAKPYLPAGERFVGDDLHFGSGAWRKENLNWNFSFGYPF